MKNLLNFVIGFCIIQWIYGPDWIHSFIVSAVTYIICLHATPRYQHIIVFSWVMGYLTCCHICLMYNSYMSLKFDFIRTQLVLTMKLTSFAYNLYDGTFDKKNVFPEEPHTDAKMAKVYNERAKFAIKKLPNPIEFFGYVYCFTCILAGPAFEFIDYKKAIDGTSFKIKKTIKKQECDNNVIISTNTNIDLNKDKVDDNTVQYTIKYPSTVLPACQRLLLGLISLVLHLLISSKYKTTMLYNKEFIQTNTILYRVFYTYLALLGYKLKFYFAWKVAEGACILGGFGFEGYVDNDNNDDNSNNNESNSKNLNKNDTNVIKIRGWKGVENIDILGFELATNIQTLSRNWNKRTQGWLERYTYNRTNRSLVATYFISAFWHGLYPGFFLFFMSLALMTNVERLIKAKINPFIVPGYDGYKIETYPRNLVGDLYWFLSWFLTQFFLLYVVQPFSMGSLENSLICLGSYNYAPYFILVVAYIVLEFMPVGKKEKKS